MENTDESGSGSEYELLFNRFGKLNAHPMKDCVEDFVKDCVHFLPIGEAITNFDALVPLMAKPIDLWELVNREILDVVSFPQHTDALGSHCFTAWHHCGRRGLNFGKLELTISFTLRIPKRLPPGME